MAEAEPVYAYNDDLMEEFEDTLYSAFYFFFSRVARKVIFVHSVTRRKPFPKEALSGVQGGSLDCVYRDIYDG